MGKGYVSKDRIWVYLILVAVLVLVHPAISLADDPPNEITVDVTTSAANAPEGVKVYAFTLGGSYTGQNAVTDANGRAAFAAIEFADGSYRFRVDYLGQQFWSSALELPGTYQIDVIIAVEAVEVTVSTAGGPAAGSKVYLFSASGSYLGIYEIADDSGKVSFVLPVGRTFKFRADLLGNRYWSDPATVSAGGVNLIGLDAGGGRLQVTIGKDPTSPMAGIKSYLFSAAGRYLGQYRVSDSLGRAGFDVPAGDYKVRADYLGNRFWTPDTVVTDDTDIDLIILHQDVTVTVSGEYQGSQALANVPVYLFTAAGAYQGQKLTTGTNGQVVFNLPEQAYKFRADYLSQKYWSDESTWQDTGVTVPMAEAAVAVTGAGAPLAGVKVYAFNAAGKYLGIVETTNADGMATYRLPAGDYKFRADYQGSQHWSDEQTLAAGQATTVGLSTGGGVFAFTVKKDTATPLTDVKCYLFSDSGRYLGLNAVTDAAGQVSFGLADGSYKVRVDYLGYQFWSPVYTVPGALSGELTIAHQDVTVTVAGEYQGGQALVNVPVYLFTAAGAYQGQKLTTDAAGQVIFSLPEQAYKVRADYLSQRYWSNDFTWQDTPITIGHGNAWVHVFSLNTDLSGVKIYLFSETGKYLGWQETTDDNGLAAFLLPDGTYLFRADIEGEQVWSPATRIAAGTDTEIDFDRSPLTVALQADSDNIDWGQTANLTWTSTGAQSCTIEPGIGAVDCSGAMEVAPKDTTTYTLTAIGPRGSDTSAVTVTVTIPDKYITAVIDHTKIDQDLTNFPVTIHLGNKSGDTGFDAADIFNELANRDINPEDDFEDSDGDIPDFDKWLVSKGNPRIQNGMLRLDMLNSIQQVKSKFRLVNDFDIEVDWQLDANVTQSWWIAQLFLIFPLNNNHWCYAGRGYTSGSGPFFRGRYHNGGANTTTVSVDAQSITSFSLRLKRTGSTVFFYYKTSGAWQSLGSAPMYASDCEVAFYLNRGDQNPRVSSAVDNFRINSGTVVWPEGYPLIKKLGVYGANNEPRYVEIESWNAANQEALLHARVPHVSATEDTVLKIVYGRHLPTNDDYIGFTGSPPARQVWDEDYLGVWHLNQVPTGYGNIKDSTSHGNHGTAHNMSAANRVPVAAGTGLHFNGTDEYISFADVAGHEILGDLSIELTTTPPATLSSNLYLVNHGGGGEAEAANFDYALRVNTAGKLYSFFEHAAGTNIVPTTQNSYVRPGNTYHLAINRDSGAQSVDFFVGGALQETVPYSANATGATSANLAFAAWHGNGSPGGFTQCDLKEIRLSRIRRSEAWVKASYHSGFDDLLRHRPSTDIDTDGDGISDLDELEVYGTKPGSTDSDYDRIDDRDELAYWGDGWDNDEDGDGITNLMDSDADNDGFLDGHELALGLDPLNLNPSSCADDRCVTAVIDHANIDEDLVNFPVRVNLSKNSGLNAYDASDVFSELALDPSDKFNGAEGSEPDTERWRLYAGTGRIENNALAFNVDGATHQSSVLSKFKLKGDFDIQVDFGLNSFSASNYSFLYFRVRYDGRNYATLRLKGNSQGTYYQSYVVANGVLGPITTLDFTRTSGRLRIKRQGETFRFYRWDEGDRAWKENSSGGIPNSYIGNLNAEVRLVLTNSTSYPEAEASFDNFKVNGGIVIDNYLNKRIRVTDLDDRQLYTEIEHWDAYKKQAALWVKIPHISASKSTAFKIYYDRNLPDQDIRPFSEADDNFDGFDGGPPDTFKWAAREGIPTIRDNKLHLRHDNATGQTESVDSIYRLLGDFDVQVDYELGAAPAATSWGLYFKAFIDAENWMGVARYHGSGHSYIQDCRVNGVQNLQQSPATTDTSGKYRLTRSGNLYRAYYREGTDWIAIGNAVAIGAAGDEVKIQLRAGAWADLPSFDGYFDNFIVNSGTVSGFVGNTGQAAAGGVWDANFKAVYHLSSDPSKGSRSVLDSTSNGNHGTPNGAMTAGDLVDGAIGGALAFDGINDYIDSGDAFYAGHLTLEAFVDPHVYDSWKSIIVKRNIGLSHQSSGNEYYLSLLDRRLGYLGSDGSSWVFQNYSEPDSLPSAGGWIYLAGKNDGSTTKIFADDQLVGTGVQSGAVGNTTSSLQIGCRAANIDTRYFDGLIDEVRISNVARSDAWIKATYFSNDDALIEYVPSPSIDTDRDGLIDFEEIHVYGTNPNSFDTDGDLLTDIFEINAGLDPLDNRVGANSDPDGDGLTNLQEQIYSLNPLLSDTDGDGTSDSVEIEQHSDPADASDNGNSPPKQELVPLSLTVGDGSASHSDRFNLSVGPITHQAPNFGEIDSGFYTIRRGAEYDIKVSHNGTDPDYCDNHIYNCPDYDYTALVNASGGCSILSDPEELLGTHYGTQFDYFSGKTARLILPMVHEITADSSSIAMGETITLTASVLPAGRPLTWSIKYPAEVKVRFVSSDSHIAHITLEESIGTGHTITVSAADREAPGCGGKVIRLKTGGCGDLASSCTDGVCRLPSDWSGYLSSIDFSFNLGKAAEGQPAGELYLEADEMSPVLATPAALRFSSLARGIDERYDEAGVLRQVLAFETLADVVEIDAYAYEIDFYHPGDITGESGGFFTIAQNAVPFATWRIENPDASPTQYNRLHLTQFKDGSVKSFEYVFDAAADTWSLSQGGGLKLIEKAETSVDNDRVVTETVRDHTGAIATQTRTIYRTYAWGERIAAVVQDPEGAALTTTYTFHEDSSQPGSYGRRKTVTHPDGSWAGYEYDDLGRKTVEVRSWLDAPADSPASQARVVYYGYTPVDAADTDEPRDLHQPRTVTETIEGVATTKTFYAYLTDESGRRIEITERCTDPAALYGDGANLRTVRTYYAEETGLAEEGEIEQVEFPDGRIDTYAYTFGTYSPAGAQPGTFAAGSGGDRQITVLHATAGHPDGVAYKSTREVTVESELGLTLLQESQVYTGGGFERLTWTVQNHDVFGRVEEVFRSDGTMTETLYGCCAREAHTDAQGIETFYTYDDLQRLESVTKAGVPAGDHAAQNDIETFYTYDAAGRRLSETVSAAELSLDTSSQYDPAARLIRRTDTAGRATTYSYTPDNLSTTVTYPGGATEITARYLDGRTRSVTGTARVARYYTYGVNADGT